MMKALLREFLRLIVESEEKSQLWKQLEELLAGSDFRIVTDPQGWPSDQLEHAMVFADRVSELGGQVPDNIEAPDILWAEKYMAEVIEVTIEATEDIRYKPGGVGKLKRFRLAARNAQRTLNRPEYEQLIRQHTDVDFVAPIIMPDDTRELFKALAKLLDAEIKLDPNGFEYMDARDPFGSARVTIKWNPASQYSSDGDIRFQATSIFNFIDVSDLREYKKLVEDKDESGYEEWRDRCG